MAKMYLKQLLHTVGKEPLETHPSTTPGKNKLAVRTTDLEDLIGSIADTKVTDPEASEASALALLRGLIDYAAKAASENTLQAVLDELKTGLKINGSLVEIGGITYQVSNGDTLRGLANDKPTAADAHAVIPYCYYYSVDTGVAEANTGTAWVVM